MLDGARSRSRVEASRPNDPGGRRRRGGADGETVCAAVAGADDMELVGRADPLLGTTLEELLGAADVVVDFTSPDVALQNALACVSAGVHVVIGTTGFDPAPLLGARPPAAAAPTC